jgi:L-serine/L-threonine ammonia-lyase
MRPASLPLHIHTPVIAAGPAYARGGRRPWFKLEHLQPSGSFKMRGIGRFCALRVAEGATGLVSPSGGNAGFAAAVAGAVLGVPTTVVVPQTTAQAVRARIAAEGAEVLVHGANWSAANEYAQALAHERGAAYVPAFDHPDLWDGHATLIDECVADGVEFDAVVCSVGGGGLFCGMVEGLRRNGLAQVPVVAVETEGAASLRAALQAGQLVTLPAITSIAVTLGASRVAQQALDLAAAHPTRVATVSDAQAVAACLTLADAQRILVEPACGAALAAWDVHPELFAGCERPLFVVCGGIGVSLAALAGWKTQFGL